MNRSSLRVTVHGRKYLITGIEKETSCRDLLCALAKATKLNPTVLPRTIAEGVQPNERSLKGVYGLKSSSGSHRRAQLNENILNKLKGDCSLAGDTETLRILNSLGSRVKIFARDSVDAAVEELEAEEGPQGYKKRRKHLSSRAEKIQNPSRSNSKHQEHTNRRAGKDLNKQDPLGGHSKGRSHFANRRSVDDSDIDSYKPDSLARIKDRRGKACDDSDVDLYQDLFHVVLEQTKQLNALRKQQREVRKSSWVRHLKRSSQIYIIDDQRAAPECVTDERREADDNNEEDEDSGLPSADYDSSASSLESTAKDENANRLVGNVQSSNLSSNPTDKLPVPSERNTLTDDICKENNVVILQINRLDELTKSLNAGSLSKQDGVGTSVSRLSVSKREPNCLNSEQPRDRRTLLEVSGNVDRLGNRLSICSLTSTTSTLRNEVLKNIKDVEIVVESPIGVEHRPNMVADAVCISNSCKKNGSVRRVSEKKKKIKKSDISEPVLIDPTAFKKHSKLRDIHSIAEHVISEATSKWSSRRSFRSSNRLKKKEDQPEFTPVDKLPPPPAMSTRLQLTSSSDSSPQLKDSSSTCLPVPDQEPGCPTSQENASSSEVVDQSGHREELKVERVPSKKGRSNSSSRNEGKRSQNRTSVILSEQACADECLLPCVAAAPDCPSRPGTTLEDTSAKATADFPNLDAEMQAVTELLSSLATDDVDIPTVFPCEQPLAKTENACSVTDTCAGAKDDHASLETSPCPCDSRPSLSVEATPMSSSYESPSRVESCLPLSNLDDRERMIVEYLSIVDAIRLLMTQIAETHQAISGLTTDLQCLETAEEEARSLNTEEEMVLKELNSVKSLLRSVTELTQYQRKEVADNIIAMDTLESEIRTKRAAFESDVCGLWKESSKHAPRTLLKRRQELKLPAKFDHISLV